MKGTLRLTLAFATASSIVWTLLESQAALAQETTVSPDSSSAVTGFGDVQLTSDHDAGNREFSLGQAELDFETRTNRFGINAAIAWADGAFEVASVVVSAILWESADSARLPYSLTIGGGQFDVPFGIDWRSYASIDRLLISTPLPVEYSHGCWNELGGYASLEFPAATITVFAAHSFFEDTTDAIQGRELGVGGRTAFRPLPALEVGGTLAAVRASDPDHYSRLTGFDLTAQIGPGTITWEYVRLYRPFPDGPDQFEDGWYIQASVEQSQCFAAIRADRYRPAVAVPFADPTSRFSAGFGVLVHKSMSTKFEYQAMPGRTNDRTIVQVTVRL
jgi:hypothetical protein